MTDNPYQSPMVAGPEDQAPPGCCSFCHRHHTVVGPLAEGPNLVLICGECVQKCGRLIAEESKKSREDQIPRHMIHRIPIAWLVAAAAIVVAVAIALWKR